MKEKKSLNEDSCQPEMTDAFEEDRYLYMCLKNRELLLKKIKQCETLESEIKDLKKDETEHKNTYVSTVFRIFSICRFGVRITNKIVIPITFYQLTNYSYIFTFL